MLKVSCPQCGAEVVFRSAALPSRVCDYCRTMLVRSPEGVAPVGTATEVPFDMSPIQLGTRGSFEERRFDVIGRVRWAYDQGSWNEWLLLFGNGETGWLGDSMGQFMMLFERPVADLRSPEAKRLIEGGEAAPGTEFQADGEKLVVGDARQVTCIACEGELPYRMPQGWRAYSVDLRSRSGRCASIQRDADGTSFYDGRYVTLAELSPTDLRRFDGWSVPAHG